MRDGCEHGQVRCQLRLTFPTSTIPLYLIAPYFADTSSRKYHPDRLGANAPAWAEAKFIAIRAAYEALSDPVRRFAYDRFGPDISSWQGAKTVRDYMIAGAQRSAGFYIVTVGLLLGLSLLGRAREGAYWRLVLVAVLLVAETSLVLAPTPSADAPATALPLLSVLPAWIAAPLATLLPQSILDRPTYMYIKLLRRLTADAGVAISQLADVWADRPKQGDEQAALQLAVQINQTALAALAEEVGPVMEGSNDPASAERNLLDRIEQVVLDRGLIAHPAVGPAYTAALARELKGKGTGVAVVDPTSVPDDGCGCGHDHGDGHSHEHAGGRAHGKAGVKKEAESDDEVGPDTFGRAMTQAHSLDFGAEAEEDDGYHKNHTDADDRITPAQLVELGRAMPLPPSPPATPAPEQSLGQVMDGTPKSVRKVKKEEEPRRRSARLSKSPLPAE